MSTRPILLSLCALLGLCAFGGCKKERRPTPPKATATPRRTRTPASKPTAPTTRAVPSTKPAAAPSQSLAPRRLASLDSNAILALMREWKPDELLRTGTSHLSVAFVEKPQMAAILVQVVGGPKDAPTVPNLTCSGSTVAEKHVYERGALHVLIAKRQAAHAGKVSYDIIAHWRRPFARPQPPKANDFEAGVCAGSFSIMPMGDLDGDGQPEFFVWHTLAGPFIDTEFSGDEVRHFYLLQLEPANTLAKRLHLQQDLTSQLDPYDQRNCKVLAADLVVRKKAVGLLEVRRLQTLPCQDNASHLDCEATDSMSAADKALCKEGCSCAKQPFSSELYRWRATEQKWVGRKVVSKGKRPRRRSRRRRPR